MRLGAAIGFALVTTSLGCDAGTPKEWQRAAPAKATIAPPSTTTAGARAPTRPAPAPTVEPAAAAESWGGTAIAWRTPEAGLDEAKRSGRPAMLVLYTSWCPHCKNYSHVFSDARVAVAAKHFVMIRANSDDAEDFARNYQPDGGYIPRTLFLKPDGSILADVRAGDGPYKYFYDEHDAAPLLAAMERAKRAVAH